MKRTKLHWFRHGKITALGAVTILLVAAPTVLFYTAVPAPAPSKETVLEPKPLFTTRPEEETPSTIPQPPVPVSVENPRMPLDDGAYWISGDYGVREIIPGVDHSGFHDGTDLAAPLGTPVKATFKGTVVFAGQGGFSTCLGYWVAVRHPELGNVITVYGHMNSVSVSVGQTVATGEIVGEVGSTGCSTGPHLHWGLYDDESYSVTHDPMQWLKENQL